MLGSRLAGMGGIYCDMEPGNKGNFNDPYTEALKSIRKSKPGYPEEMRPLWSQRPLRGCKGPDEITFPYEPDQLPDAPDAAVIWQYGLDCLKSPGQAHGLIDMDLATERGYRYMWDLS
jgi:hypothetical protein